MLDEKVLEMFKLNDLYSQAGIFYYEEEKRPVEEVAYSSRPKVIEASAYRMGELFDSVLGFFNRMHPDEVVVNKDHHLLRSNSDQRGKVENHEIDHGYHLHENVVRYWTGTTMLNDYTN